MADMSKHHTERGRSLALAGPGVDDQEAFLANLGRHDLVARRLVLARLLPVPFILGLVCFGRHSGHAISFCAIGKSAAIRSAARLERGVHSPRRIASAKRSAVSRSAAGLAVCMKSRTRSSSR